MPTATWEPGPRLLLGRAFGFSSSAFGHRTRTHRPPVGSTARARRTWYVANDYTIHWSGQLERMGNVIEPTIESSGGHRCPWSGRYNGFHCLGCCIGQWSGSLDQGRSMLSARCLSLSCGGRVGPLNGEARNGKVYMRMPAGWVGIRSRKRKVWTVVSPAGPVGGHAVHLPCLPRRREGRRMRS